MPDGEGGQAFAEEHIQACSTFIADIVPVGPGGRNAPILAFGAPDLQDWDGRHGRPPQVQTVSNRILVRINGHKCTEFRDENAAPLSVPAIRENCRRAEKTIRRCYPRERWA